MKDYFDFIVYLAFRAILMYENKRSLTIEQLHNYRIMICEKHIKYHSKYTSYDDLDFKENLDYFHSTNKNMTLKEEMLNLVEFLKVNDEYFSYKDGVISLKNEVNYKDLEDINFGLDSYNDRDDKIICGELNGFFDSVECLDILGITKIKDLVSKIVDDEKKIESAYQVYTENKLEENINKLSFLVNYRLALIGNLKEDKIRCHHRMLGNLGDVDDNSKRDNVRLLSDYLVNNDEFYNVNSRSVERIINNKYQRAIFDNGTLVYDKLNNIFDMIWAYREPNLQMEIEPVDNEAMFLSLEERMAELDAFYDEFEDDEEELDHDDYDDMDLVEIYLYDKRIKMTFYLNYIDHIEKILENFEGNKVLENTKSRLLYLLDSYGDNLFKRENFLNALNNLSMDGINYKDDFDDFYVLSRLFLIDILDEKLDDETILRKILFISTYYDLTNDRRIKRIINKYRKTDLGEKVSEIILKNNYDKLSSFSVNSVKRLIKKKDK